MDNLPSGNSHREDLKVVEEEINRINEIVDQFLRFAKPAPPLLESADVISVFEETLQLLRPQIEREQITVQKEFQALPIILMDREQMKQAILNLLLNAIQAMPGGGHLTLRGQNSKDGQWIHVSIQDSGVGIPDEDMGKLFDPFFSTKEGGVGLGLSIAHRIIDQHHGNIEVESAHGKGTLFTLWLPIHNERWTMNGGQ
jgi:signal transduction histidine kinase